MNSNQERREESITVYSISYQTTTHSSALELTYLLIMFTKNNYSSFRMATVLTLILILTLILLRSSSSSSSLSSSSLPASNGITITSITSIVDSNKDNYIDIEMEQQRSNEEGQQQQQQQQQRMIFKKKNSPLRQQRRLRFALVDIDVSFWYLPSTTTTTTTNMNTMNVISPLPLGTIQTACRHFLTRELNVNPLTTIFGVGVRVISQQQIVNNSNNGSGSSSSDSRQSSTDGLKMNDDDLITTATTTTIATTGTTISGFSNANVIAAHAITTKLEVTVQYGLNKEITELNDMNGRIRMLFSTQWKDLLDLLVLLDEDYFGNVFAIGLESSKSPLTFSTTNGDQRISIESSNDEDTTWQSLSPYLIIGLAAIGMGITLLFIMSQIISREQDISNNNNNDNNRNYRKTERPKLQPISSNFKTITESVFVDPPANNDIPSFTPTATTTTTTNITDDDDGSVKISNGRRIKSYSSKEKQNSIVTASMASTKEDSILEAARKRTIKPVFLEDKLQRTFEFVDKKLDSRTKKDNSKVDSNSTEKNSKRIQASRTKKRKQEIECQIQVLRNKRKLIEDQIEAKFETLTELSQSVSDRRVPDDISAITCEIFHIDEDSDEDDKEDQELEVLSMEDNKESRRCQKKKNGRRKFMLPYHEKEYY
jgi:hypothetical protein